MATPYCLKSPGTYVVTTQLSSASLARTPSHERLKDDVTFRTKMTGDVEVSALVVRDTKWRLSWKHNRALYLRNIIYRTERA
ncbi:hypothetical protein BDP55DRAFT_640132 [Colletotrichum godetiae]|uniref:Uncharacterized protein n=1 Tax=Colletotrichum godetiae TaxID=1209918 RepID=A0AAJ0AZ68_9PEZI|nr:uncharacterized protein BDP55DRAFT_640132 [Colletotrichum godetiae]KAK1701006.1 hypothetical protein BDP55DRAFT_640132 [Colletotrichum godetiae]